MIKEAIGIGSTIEAAKEDAVLKLGASELDDVQYDVIKMPKKKALGIFGGSNAEVKAYIEIADKKDKKTPTKKEAKPQEKKEEQNRNESAKPKKPETEKTQKPAEKAEPKYGEPVEEAKISADSPAGKAIAYIRTVLDTFGCKDIVITVAEGDNASLLNLNGEDISIIIGRRGETLDALQYLCSLAANNGGGRHKISLNIGNYREKREETLQILAKRISAQVLKTGKCRTLEPMNPYERRIIHTAVQNIEGVESKSFGEGVGRRIVISPEGAQVRPPKMSSNGNRRGDSHRRSSRQSGQRVAPVSDPAREPKKDTDIPLYGKIN